MPLMVLLIIGILIYNLIGTVYAVGLCIAGVTASALTGGRGGSPHVPLNCGDVGLPPCPRICGCVSTFRTSHEVLNR